MKDKSIVGDLINFRGLVYSPTNENGVIFLFGKVVEDLYMYIEEIKPGFPDCVARRFTGRGWERTYVEFEYTSLNFLHHKHDHRECDLIVCWEHNWPECPIEVIELKEVIKELPNEPINPPDTSPNADVNSLEEYLVEVPKKVQNLFYELDSQIKDISDSIWHKVAKRSTITYYSPERVFVYLHLRKKGLSFYVFTRGEGIEGVPASEPKEGDLWRMVRITDPAQLPAALRVIKRSYLLIKEEIKHNEPTGRHVSIEDEEDEETASSLDTEEQQAEQSD